MRVFVLSPGRSGSLTFIKACEHIANYAAGHESRTSLVGPERFDFPDRHIEADNRLTWMLGLLAQHVQQGDRFVWLRRDRDEVARSFERRWRYSYRAGMIEAFAHAIVQHAGDWPQEARLDVARYYVDVVEANIEEFLINRDSLIVRLGTDDFADFWSWIGAEGDLGAARREWSTRHNSSPGVTG